MEVIEAAGIILVLFMGGRQIISGRMERKKCIIKHTGSVPN